MYYIHKLLFYVFVVKTNSILCLLLSNDKFYIHFGGFLGYRINEYEYDKVHLSVRLRAKQQNGYGCDHNYQHDWFKAFAFYAP